MALVAALAWLVGIAPPASAAPAGVHMPFPCGETWYASTRAGNLPSEYAVDWNLLSDDSGRSVRAGVAGTATVKPFHISHAEGLHLKLPSNTPAIPTAWFQDDKMH